MPSAVPEILLYGQHLTPYTVKVARGLCLKKLPFRLIEPQSLEDYRRFNPETDAEPHWESYDLEADPFELENLAGAPGLDALRAELRAELDRLLLQGVLRRTPRTPPLAPRE